jgi:FkbM family methyltransferase
LRALKSASIGTTDFAVMRQFTIPLERLDSLVATSREVSFIKRDVEDNEQAVLRGADRTVTPPAPSVERPWSWALQLLVCSPGEPR